MKLKICNVLTKGKEIKCIDGRIEPQGIRKRGNVNGEPGKTGSKCGRGSSSFPVVRVIRVYCTVDLRNLEARLS